MPAKTPKEKGGTGNGSDLGEPPPSANPNITSPAIAAILNNMKTLCTLLPARAPRQLMPVSPSQHHSRDHAAVPSYSRKRAKVGRENDCHRSHPAGLRHKKQSPSIYKGNRRMICLAQVQILATGSGQTSCQFSPDKRAPHGKNPAQHPNAED